MRPAPMTVTQLLEQFIRAIFNLLDRPKENEVALEQLFTGLLDAVDTIFKDKSVPLFLIKEVQKNLDLDKSESIETKLLNLGFTLLEGESQRLLELCLSTCIKLYIFSSENSVLQANLCAGVIENLLLSGQVEKAKEIFESYSFFDNHIRYADRAKRERVARLFEENALISEAVTCYETLRSNSMDADETADYYLSIFSLSLSDKSTKMLEKYFCECIRCLYSKSKKDSDLVVHRLEEKLTKINNILLDVLREQTHSFENFKNLLSFIINNYRFKITPDGYKNLFAVSQYLSVILGYSKEDTRNYLKQFWNLPRQRSLYNVLLTESIFPNLLSIELFHCMNRNRLSKLIMYFYNKNKLFFDEKLNINSLHMVVLNNKPITMDLLSDVNCLSEMGTPLSIACRYARELKTVCFLMEKTASHLRGRAVSEVFSITLSDEQRRDKYRLKILERFFELGGSIDELSNFTSISFWAWSEISNEEKVEISQLINFLLENKLNIETFTEDNGYSILYEITASTEWYDPDDYDAHTENFLKNLLRHNANIHRVFSNRHIEGATPLTAAFKYLKPLKIMFQYMLAIPINAISFHYGFDVMNFPGFDYNKFQNVSFGASSECWKFVLDCQSKSNALLTHFRDEDWAKVKNILSSDLAPCIINHICLDNDKTKITSPLLPALIEKYHKSQVASKRTLLLKIITCCLNFDNIKLDIKDKNGNTAMSLVTAYRLESLIFSPAEIILRDLLVNAPKEFIKVMKDIIVKVRLDKLFTDQAAVTIPIDCQFCHDVATDKGKDNLLTAFNENGVTFGKNNMVTVNLGFDSAKRIFVQWQYLIEHRGKHHCPETEKVIEEINQKIQKAQHNQWGVPFVQTSAMNIATALFAVVRGSVKVLSEIMSSWTANLTEQNRSKRSEGDQSKTTPSKTEDITLFSKNTTAESDELPKSDQANNPPGQ